MRICRSKDMVENIRFSQKKKQQFYAFYLMVTPLCFVTFISKYKEIYVYFLLKYSKSIFYRYTRTIKREKWSSLKQGCGAGQSPAPAPILLAPEPAPNYWLPAPGAGSRLLAPSSGSWLRLPNLLFHFILTSLPNLTDNLKLDRIIVSLYFLDLETQSNLYNLSFFI